ncbi:MAG: cell division protein FtsQ, partial [Clostridiales bacterium]|nr:cell division protein FtsQ [Clostridiales bacterium]
MRKKRKRRLIRIGFLILFLAAVLSGIFFFRVRKVVVTGNSRYSAEKIKEDLVADFWSGNTLYLW